MWKRLTWTFFNAHRKEAKKIISRGHQNNGKPYVLGAYWYETFYSICGALNETQLNFEWYKVSFVPDLMGNCEIDGFDQSIHFCTLVECMEYVKIIL